MSKISYPPPLDLGHSPQLFLASQIRISDAKRQNKTISESGNPWPNASNQINGQKTQHQNRSFALIPALKTCVGWLSPHFHFALVAWITEPLLTISNEDFVYYFCSKQHIAVQPTHVTWLEWYMFNKYKSKRTNIKVIKVILPK